VKNFLFCLTSSTRSTGTMVIELDCDAIVSSVEEKRGLERARRHIAQVLQKMSPGRFIGARVSGNRFVISMDRASGGDAAEILNILQAELAEFSGGRRVSLTVAELGAEGASRSLSSLKNQLSIRGLTSTGAACLN
jgi:hypothetical protein